MRWELTFIIPGGGNTATNRDLPGRLLMMSVQLVLMCERPPFALRKCIAFLNRGIFFFPESFSLVCRMQETGDRRRTSVNKPSRLVHAWGAVWNYPPRCYLNVINAIKGCLFVWYEEAGSLSALITPTHYLQSAQTCLSLRVPLMLGRIFKWATEVWKATMQAGKQPVSVFLSVN